MAAELPGPGALPGEGVPRVDALYAGKAHRLAEEWVARGGVPGERAEAMPVAGVAGLRVTLRMDGSTLGTGTTLRPDLADWLAQHQPGGTASPRPGQDAIDLVGLLEPAVTQALGEVASRLQNGPARPAADASPDPAAAPRPRLGRSLTLADVLPALRVDVQVLHDPSPVVIGPEAPDDALYARFAPGYHGLIALSPDGLPPGVVWPATALAQNASPRRQVLELLTALGMKFNQTNRLGRPGGPAIYRTDVLHFVRARADLPAMQLTRGAELLPEQFISERTLRGMTDRVAFHLFGRLIGNGRVRGAYHPVTGRYAPALADDLHAALTAYSLVAYVRGQREAGHVGELLDRMEREAVEVVEQVIGRLLAPDAEPDLVAAAFCLLALVDAQPATYEPALRGRVAGPLTRRLDPQAPPPAAADDAATSAAPASRAVALASLAALYSQTREAAVGDLLAAGLAGLWEQAQGRFDLNTLPWVTLALDRAGGLLVEDGRLTAEQRAAWSGDLTVYFEGVAERQVVGRPTLGPPDVVGGVVLAPGPEGSPPNPTWQTAQVLMYLALAARDTAIVEPRQRPSVLVTAGGAARFLAQLMMDTPGCFATPSPGDATGGIRLSPWDNTLALPPSAFTLLSLVELRRTTDTLDGLDPAR